MICQPCQTQMEVRDSRPIHNGAMVRRRRCCVTCNSKITTYEIAADSILRQPKCGDVMTITVNGEVQFIGIGNLSRRIGLEAQRMIGEAFGKDISLPDLIEDEEADAGS